MVDFHDSIAFMIAKANQYAQGVLKVQFKAFGLTAVRCLVLESLWDEEGFSVGEVGRRLTFDKATLAGVLDRMATACWVLREVSSADSRVARIYLCEKAKAITADLARTIEQANNELLGKRFLRDYFT